MSGPTALFEGLRREQSSLSTHTFTLTFLGGQIAVLEVRGATSQEQARDLAEHALPQCPYSVVDGDQSYGHVDAFYLWCEPGKEEGR